MLTVLLLAVLGCITSSIMQTSVPPIFPAAWKATTHGNLTHPGFFAGDVVLDYAVDCTEGPAKQKMMTVYPDRYTVITRCDLGYQYIIGPASRGLSCDIWELKPITCSQCGCPFCIQSTGNEWQKDMQWEGTRQRSTSPITGQTVDVWRGKQVTGAQLLPIEFSVSLDSKPVSMVLNSSQWISSVTWFENFTEGVGAHDFEPPASVTCPPPPTTPFKKYPPHPVTDLSRDSSATAQAGSLNKPYWPYLERPAIPPTFPGRFKASMLFNISQPGYDGGNLFLNFTQDCSKGPATQIHKTIFGNFHAVFLNCSSGIVHSWNQPPGAPEAFDCKVQGRINQDFPLDVCNTCGMPFSVGSTQGVYTTSNGKNQFGWEESPGHFAGVERTAGSKLAMDVYPVEDSWFKVGD